MDYKDNMVDHPNHYKASNGMEVIDVIEAFTKNLSGVEATDTGNVIKYILRWHEKNGLQDLKKAHWYLEHLINKIEKDIEGSMNKPVEDRYAPPIIGVNTEHHAYNVKLAFENTILAEGVASLAYFKQLCERPDMIKPDDIYWGWVAVPRIDIEYNPMTEKYELYIRDHAININIEERDI